MKAEISSPNDVFVNCPFDIQYSRLFEAQIFSIFACGFRARSARELDDGGQTRIEKLYSIIRNCRYGIHDLSRTELDDINHLPRFNMPLELGLFLGAKKFGKGAHGLKRCLILDIEPFRYQRFISDLAGMDIRDHSSNPEQIVVIVRDWLANVSRRQISGGENILSAYRRFVVELPDIAAQLGHNIDCIPYVDFENIAVRWLLNAQP